MAGARPTSKASVRGIKSAYSHFVSAPFVYNFCVCVDRTHSLSAEIHKHKNFQLNLLTSRCALTDKIRHLFVSIVFRFALVRYEQIREVVAVYLFSQHMFNR